jgi:phosphoribosylanthranilate isomerase
LCRSATKGAQRGGNGTTFDWRVLANYHGPTPFLLSGGLGPNNAGELLAFKHPNLAGYDFNSQLETAPGVKDVEATRALLTTLHQQAANS